MRAAFVSRVFVSKFPGLIFGIASERFLMSTARLRTSMGDVDAIDLIVMLNWLDELQRLVPTGR